MKEIPKEFEEIFNALFKQKNKEEGKQVLKIKAVTLFVQGEEVHYAEGKDSVVKVGQSKDGETIIEYDNGECLVYSKDFPYILTAEKPEPIEPKEPTQW